MNRRTLKKLCRRAMAELIRDHGCSADQFLRAHGDETVDAPCTMERRFSEHGFMTPLRGTPLLWRQVSIEYDEWDCFLPIDELSKVKAYQNFDPIAEGLAA